MATTMKSLGIDKLEASERRALAWEIWESLGETQNDSRLSAEQWAELERRNREMDEHPERTKTWEEFRATLEGNP